MFHGLLNHMMKGILNNNNKKILYEWALFSKKTDQHQMELEQQGGKQIITIKIINPAIRFSQPNYSEG